MELIDYIQMKSYQNRFKILWNFTKKFRFTSVGVKLKNLENSTHVRHLKSDLFIFTLQFWGK